MLKYRISLCSISTLAPMATINLLIRARRDTKYQLVLYGRAHLSSLISLIDDQLTRSGVQLFRLTSQSAVPRHVQIVTR